MKTEDFESMTKLISHGGDVDQEELVEVLCYAGNAWYEIQKLTKDLCAGYLALQKDIARKDNKLEIANKMLTAVRAENERLRAEIARLRGEIATGSASPRNDKGTDLSASVDTVIKLDGVISDETRLALLPLDIDAKEELEKVEEQKLSNFSLFGANFNEVDDGEEDERRTREEER